MRVAIIGMGTVGTAMHRFLEDHAEVVTYDVLTTSGYPSDELARCDFALVCVDTPPGPGGACDTTHVEAAVVAVPVDRVLIRSTVAPGTTDRLAAATGKSICFAPEYIGESTHSHRHWGLLERDVPFLILGGAPEARRWFIDRFVGILGPEVHYYQCSAVEAEMVKYMENAFLATKVSFVNEFYDLCELFGADWHTVREGWLLDPRIGRSHSAVFPDDRGFGGKCLPKDLDAIVAAASAAGYLPLLLEAVVAANRRHRGDPGVPRACGEARIASLRGA